MRSGDIRQADGFVIRLGRSGKERAKPDVIGAFVSGRARLFKAVSRFSDQQLSSTLFARLVNGKIVLPHVHANRANHSGNLRIIIDDQRNRVLCGQCPQLRSEGFQLRNALFFASELQDIHPAIDHFPGDSDRVVRGDVGQIKNAVEPALAKRCQNYWSNRVGGELNSKFPEFITRSTKPVS